MNNENIIYHVIYERFFLYEKNSIMLKSIFDFISLKMYNFTNFKFIIYFREFIWIYLDELYLSILTLIGFSSCFKSKIAMV